MFLTGSPNDSWDKESIFSQIPYILSFDQRSSSNINGVTAISKFDLLFTSWPSYLTFDLINLQYNVQYQATYLDKPSDGWLKTATCILENVTISFKHEYR